MKGKGKVIILLLLAGCLFFSAAGCAEGSAAPQGPEEQVPPVQQPGEPEMPEEQTPPVQQPGEPESPEEQEEAMYIHVNGNVFTMTFAQTEAAAALQARLSEGDIVYTAHEYGGIEMVGELGFSPPARDERITARTGDVMLYQGDQMVIFFGSNTWSYTRLGAIAANEEALRAAFGAGRTEVRLSLDK